MFTAWGAPGSRPTKDIDLLARMDNSVEAVAAVMRDVCGQDVEPDGIVFDPDNVAGVAIKEDADYSGVRVVADEVLEDALGGQPLFEHGRDDGPPRLAVAGPTGSRGGTLRAHRRTGRFGLRLNRFGADGPFAGFDSPGADVR